jgi:hypothetical protein
VAEAAPTTSTQANPSARAVRARMRMSDSSGQETVMSQGANWRSLNVPGSRSAGFKPGLRVPISLSFHSYRRIAASAEARHLAALVRGAAFGPHPVSTRRQPLSPNPTKDRREHKILNRGSRAWCCEVAWERLATQEGSFDP